MVQITGGKKSSAKKIPAVGSRAQVYHGNAKHTSGGLHKKDLMKKAGRIVSRKASAAAKKKFKKMPKALKAKFTENKKKMKKGEIKKPKSHKKKSHSKKKKPAMKKRKQSPARKRCVKKCVKKCKK